MEVIFNTPEGEKIILDIPCPPTEGSILNFPERTFRSAAPVWEFNQEGFAFVNIYMTDVEAE
ncbi:hypothetical protein [Parasegetibacter sp. NRK P23]|uniref:hypothetical protein n=1 Tax=Parasegetibacter sp. NRK P23 TaxID=2942999 RepID=UPI0020448F9A|nr:hypothetical protein [Parasegetibacter sp. NRK P23]MCM5528984.1 hypothetical protein [Parasegetibacter sp. NRK P23]